MYENERNLTEACEYVMISNPILIQLSFDFFKFSINGFKYYFYRVAWQPQIRL